jgi:hypothetical protein
MKEKYEPHPTFKQIRTKIIFFSYLLPANGTLSTQKNRILHIWHSKRSKAKNVIELSMNDENNGIQA